LKVRISFIFFPLFFCEVLTLKQSDNDGPDDYKIASTTPTLLHWPGHAVRLPHGRLSRLPGHGAAPSPERCRAEVNLQHSQPPRFLSRFLSRPS
jgi:hypothetical protein